MQTEKKPAKETMRMDTKDEVQVDIKTAEGAGQPDLPRLLEQTLHSFHEVNRGLHRVQQEIAALMQHAVVQQAIQGRGDARAFGNAFGANPGAFPTGAFGLGSPVAGMSGAASYGGASSGRTGPGAGPGTGPSGFGGFAGPSLANGFSGGFSGGSGAFAVPGGLGMTPPGMPGGLNGVFSPPSFPGARSALRFSRDLKTDPPTTRVPECNVVDQGKEYHVQIEVPGVKKDNLDILCFEQSIVVTAKAESELEDGTLLLNERGPVVYRRTIPLPSEIQTNVSKATLKDGVLTVRLAKRVPTEGPRRLDVAYG